MTLLRHDNLWTLTRGERLRYLGMLLVVGAANACLFGAPLIAKSAIDVVVQQDNTQAAAWFVAPAAWLGVPLTGSTLSYLLSSAVAMVLITALGGYFQYLRGQLSAVAAESIARRLRDELYRRLSHLRAAFYDSADTGDLVQRCSSDVETLRVFYTGDVVEVGRVLLLLVILTPILFSMHAGLAWLSLATFPLQLAFAYMFFSRVKQVFEMTDVAEAAMTAVLQENLTGVRVVRAFARQDYEIARFAERNARHRDASVRVLRLLGIYWTCSDFACFAQIGLVLIVGGMFAMEAKISVGTLFAFLTCETLVLWPLRQMGRVLSESGKAAVALGRVRAILDADEEPIGATPDSARARVKPSPSSVRRGPAKRR
jgi:ATP-binding cassette subfamily B protein